MVCEHLRKLEQELKSDGVKETYRGTPWSKNCREWVYFDVGFNIDKIISRMKFPPCVKVHVNLDRKSGTERGFYCEECKDAIMGLVDRWDYESEWAPHERDLGTRIVSPDLISKRDENLRRTSSAFNSWFHDHALQRCLANDCNCSESVIKAHSVQSSYVIQPLAKDNHVYMFQSGVDRGLALVSYHKATTFTGFCARHDNNLFKEIDFHREMKFDPFEKKQIVLLSLRAAAREYWTKLNNRKYFSLLIKHWTRKDIDSIAAMINMKKEDIITRFPSYIEDFAEPFLLGTKESTDRIGRTYKSLYNQVQTNGFHLTIAKVFKIETQPTIAGNSVMAPEYDLEGNVLNSLELSSEITDVAMTIMPSEKSTYAIFAYHKRYKHYLEKFFLQISSLSQTELQIVLSKLILMHCENLVLSPRFIEKLSQEKKRELEKLFFSTTMEAFPYHQVPNISLFLA